MRRSRIQRQSSGKRLSPTPRAIAAFHAISRHGMLSKTFLHGFTKHIAHDLTGLAHALEDLYHEKDTLHGGPYLSRPEKQFNSFFARYQELLHDLTPYSELALQDAGLLPEPYHYVRKNLPHAHMKANITASIELACQKRGAIYRPKPRGLVLSFPVSTTWNGYTLDMPYEPDDLFSIEWEGKERFYLHETDKDQEPVTRKGSDPFKTSSWQRKVIQLTVVTRVLREQLGRPVMVLTVTTNHDHMRSMLQCIKDTTGGSNYHLLKTQTEFAGPFRVIRNPIEDILDGWHRCEGYSQFNLLPSDIVKEAAQTKESARAV